MLHSLSIKNFALIEDIELSLDNGMSIITGETGAGKSILLGALALLLGKRANLKSIKNPKKKCIIEGVFAIQNYQLQSFFETHDLDYEDSTIIRREILPSGKSRAFINDTPVKLKQLSTLGKNLVDIHSQHETLFVGNQEYQYRVIDALAGNEKLLQSYHNSLQQYKNLQKELEKLMTQQHEAQKTYDYNLFLLNELRESNLKEGLQEKLEKRNKELANVEELKENLAYALQQLQRDELGIADNLQEVQKRLGRLEDYGNAYRELSSRMQSVILEVQDLTMEIEGLTDDIEDNPEELELVNEQLQNLYNLQKKHNAGSVKELLQLQEELEKQVDQSENAEKNTAALENKIKKAEQKTQEIARKLTVKRKKVTPKFIRSVQELLKKLGMPNAELKIDFENSTAFTSHGKDQMSWLFSANKGGRFQALKNSASGGELSRIALAIKSVLANYSKMPTLIFDEIDTGVSGEIAQKMGEIMLKMSSRLQVISITHLPQIAAKGEQHYKVYKQIEKGNTQTIITKLTPEERITELAEMLGGKEKTASAVAHAKSLLN